MATRPILTLRQYVDRAHRRMVAEYPDVTLSEVRECYPAESLYSEWWDYVTAGVEAGRIPSTRLWRSFDDRQQYELLRTSRALSDDGFTHRLIAMGR